MRNLKKFLGPCLLAPRSRKAGSRSLSLFPFGEMSKLPLNTSPQEFYQDSSVCAMLWVWNNTLTGACTFLCVLLHRSGNMLQFCSRLHHKTCVTMRIEKGGGCVRVCVCLCVCAPPSSTARPMSGDNAAL